MPRAPLIREELLDRGEHDSAARDLQQIAKVVAALGLHRLLTQQLVAPRERSEELIIQIVSIREHNDSRVLHLRLKDEPSRIEDHRQRLTRSLRVPNDTHTPVARRAARL